jgi:hypothetical protein
MVTVLPPADAGFDKLMVQVLVAFWLSADGAHCTAVTRTGAINAMFTVAALPFREAVTAALLSLAIVVTATLNAADMPPAGTAMDVGTVSTADVDEMLTVLPPVSAGFDRPTVQTLLEFCVKLDGAH